MTTQNIILTVLAIILVIGIVWVGGRQPASQAPITSDTPAVVSDTKTEPTITTTNTKPMTTVIIMTNKGAVTLELFGDKTPKTVENFVKLAKEGFYNGTRFHRVIKGFMIQGGDPLSKDIANQNRWGTGGPGYSFADELGGTNNANSNVIGTIAMANSGPNTNGSQFFINTANNNFLDTKHVVFGRVTAGMDVVTAIESTKTGAQDRPVEDIIIESVEVK